MHTFFTSNSSICLIDRTLPGTTTPVQSGHRNNSNEGVLYFPESSKTGTSPSDCFVSYPGNSLRESYSSAVGVFYSHSRQGICASMSLYFKTKASVTQRRIFSPVSSQTDCIAVWYLFHIAFILVHLNWWLKFFSQTSLLIFRIPIPLFILSYTHLGPLV